MQNATCAARWGRVSLEEDFVTDAPVANLAAAVAVLPASAEVPQVPVGEVVADEQGDSAVWHNHRRTNVRPAVGSAGQRPDSQHRQPAVPGTSAWVPGARKPRTVLWRIPTPGPRGQRGSNPRPRRTPG
jgi:hypothetical protein